LKVMLSTDSFGIEPDNEFSGSDSSNLMSSGASSLIKSVTDLANDFAFVRARSFAGAALGHRPRSLSIQLPHRGPTGRQMT
jgi:hypothetical protein